MEFRFNLNELFPESCVEIGNTLIPPGFTGDKRALWDTQSKVTQIVNAMGEASAHAQGLTKPITTADRLRNSEHRLYLLMDPAANNGKGAVTGMLKTGQKGLYVFDREGQHYQVSPHCVLDFYIHESRQRTGLGRRLFEHMLESEQLEPNKMAIDRPSDKFLGFLNKHYGFNTPVKQMNNYVVFDGFFPKHAGTPNKIPTDKSNTPTKKQSANGLQQSYHSSPYGRYAAAHPACSMGQIIHNDSAVINRNQEPTGVKSEPVVTHTQGGLDRYNNVNGNQSAWQTTQSVPNMPIAQNQYPYSQNNAMPQNQYYHYMAQGDATNQNAPQSYYYPPQNQQIRAPQPIRTKEPLIPQSFDGTARKMPHSAQSMPAQGDRRQIPAPFALQNTVSAPNNYQQQPAMTNNYPQNAGFVQPATVNNQQPTVQQNVAHMNQMYPGVPQQIQNDGNNQTMQINSQMNPIVNQVNPGVPQQTYNDGTNQMNHMSNLNQTNPGVPQQSYNDGTNLMNNHMTNLIQTNPGVPQQSYNDGTNQMNNHMTNQNQSNSGASQMNTTINQNQMNPPINQNQVNNPNLTNPALNPYPTEIATIQVTNQMQPSADNQNNTIPAMVNKNEISQNQMPNTVYGQQQNTTQQKSNNEGNTYPQMYNQFENLALQPSGNNQQILVSSDQQPSQLTNYYGAPQQNVANEPLPEAARVPCYQDGVDLSKGYPPQQPQSPVPSSARPPIIVRN